MITVKDVTKKFDSVCALDGLELNVPKGSVYGLIGPNGAGKTTILKILSGVYKKNSGTVLIDGEDVFENQKIKEKITFVSDDLFFFTTYTIKDTSKLYRGIYKNWSDERFEALGEIFKIDTNRKVRSLSKGMQKQVAFWLSISAQPDIMLLDEPVDGLDPVMRRNVWKLIMQDVAERGTTVLVSSHNLRELEDVCDHVGIMHRGKIILEKALDDVKGSTHKLQVAFNEGLPMVLSEKLSPLHTETYGSVNMLIVKGDCDEIKKTVKEFSPLICDILPLTLEEIFIYELGGLGYEFENIIL